MGVAPQLSSGQDTPLLPFPVLASLKMSAIVKICFLLLWKLTRPNEPTTFRQEVAIPTEASTPPPPTLTLYGAAVIRGSTTTCEKTDSASNLAHQSPCSVRNAEEYAV